MNHLIAQSLQNIEDVTDGAPEPKTPSAGATPEGPVQSRSLALARGSPAPLRRVVWAQRTIKGYSTRYYDCDLECGHYRVVRRSKVPTRLRCERCAEEQGNKNDEQ